MKSGNALVEPPRSENTRRLEQILRSKSQEGTALDKFYDALLQEGHLDNYCERLLQDASAQKDGGLYQLLGLIRSKQGMDAEAITALENARLLRPNDPTIPYYLAKAYYVAGRNIDVYESVKASLAQKPLPSLLPNLIQLLVKVDRREESHRGLAEIGGMIEKEFTNNFSILRKLSDGYLECKSPELANRLLQKLISAAKSPQEEIELRIQLADVKSQLGQDAESLADFEQILQRVNPDSWLSESIVQNIERLIEKRGGPEALIDYYRSCLEAGKKESDGNGKKTVNRGTLKSMLRLAAILIQSNRSDDAIEVVHEAQLIAPSDAKPLLVLEEIQNARRDFAGAAATMKKLVELDESNVDYRVRWGRYVSLIPNDSKRYQDEAAAIWSTLMNGRENDPAMFVRVAELLHGISRTSEAIEYFQKAVRQSGNAAQYREYLGEYLFRLGQSDQALAVFQNLSEKDRDGPGYARLSEVLSQLNFKSEALQAMLQASDLNPTFEILIRCAEMLRTAERFGEALERLDAAEKLAMRTTDFAKVWALQLIVLPLAGSIPDRIASVTKKMALVTDSEESSRYSQRLALLYRASGDLDSAVKCVSTAIQRTPNSELAWLSASMVYRAANLTFQELQALDNLCRLDIPNRLDYLQRMAILQMQLRKPEEALAVGERMLNEPGSTSQQLKFFFALCGEAQQKELGRAIVQRYADRNPRDAYARLILAKIQMDNGQVAQAITGGWTVLKSERTDDLALETVKLLISAYRKQGQLAELPELFRRFGLEHKRQRDAAYWISFTQHELGDSALAWQSLERTLARSNNDIELMKLALKVAIGAGKIKDAVDCQRQLNQLEPTAVGQLKLGELLFDAGDIAAALQEWRNAIGQRNREAVTHRFVRELIANQRLAVATAFLEIATAALPDRWELLALNIAAHQQAGNPDQAVTFADRILGLKNAFDQKAMVLDDEFDATNADSRLTRMIPLNERSEIKPNRLAWLERADQWQPMFNATDLFHAAIRSQESVASVAQRSAIHRLAAQRGAAVRITKKPSFYLPTFGDAHALAVLAKYGRINRQPATELASQSAFLKRCAESKDIGQLWDAVLVLQPTAFGSSDDQSDDRFLYRKCLDELAGLGDNQAIQLALNDLVLTRSIQRQMAARRMESAPSMPTKEIARFAHLVDLCYQRKCRPNLFVDVQLAKELERIGRGQDASQVLSRGLASSQSLDEVARCSQEFLPGDVETAKSILMQGIEIHSKELISKPGIDSSSTLKAIFDDAWRRDVNEVGKNTSEFFSYFSKLIAIHGDAIDNSSIGSFAWDPSFNMENTLQLADGKDFSLSSDFLRPSAVVPSTFLMTLHHIYGITKKHRGSADLLNVIGTSSTYPSTSANHGRTLVHLACKSAWHWWHQNSKEAIVAVREAKKLGIAAELLTLWESQMLVYSEQAQAAIELLAQVKPLNEVMAVDRYLLVVQAARLVGNSNLVEETKRQLSNRPKTTYQSQWLRHLDDAAVQ